MSIYVKHNNQYIKLPYFDSGDIPVYDQGTIKYLRSTSTPGLVAFLDRNQIKYIDLNALYGAIYGFYLPAKDVDVTWGDYDGGSAMQHIITPNDCDMIDQYLMIEHNWHVIQGSNAGISQMNLYDANSQLMDNPEFIIDIYYKLITARPDNYSAGLGILNPNNKVNTYYFNNYGFIPTFLKDQNTNYYIGAYIENPSSPFDLPSDSVLKDGYTNVQFPTGMIFDYLSGNSWNYNIGDGNGLGRFLNICNSYGGNNNMLTICEMYNQDEITYTIDPSQVGMGIPFDAVYPGSAYMPALFTGFLGCAENLYKNGILYICLGVHHI